jgi:iron complex outermembrane recepter protein
MVRCMSAGCLLAALTVGPVSARSNSGGAGSGSDLASLSLSELMNVEVTSVSKRQQQQSRAPAAIFVITQDDIHRSTATSIPELLRIVPGLEVARIDANKWAITSRGFTGRFANKMLVLVDGRSVYTPLFSGVLWDTIDTTLEDIQRIEVIRGPGATMWGANAVNGVINIITKPATETQGALLTVGGGNADRGFTGMRYGGKIGTTGALRAYGKYSNRAAFTTRLGQDAQDGWNHARGGFRADWQTAGPDTFLVEGDVFRSAAAGGVYLDGGTTPAAAPVEGATSRGANVLGRWRRQHNGHAETTLQAYFDATDYNIYSVGERRNTLDFDLQHVFSPLGRHQLMAGTGYRFTSDHLRVNPRVDFSPLQRSDSLVSGFLQDEIGFAGNRIVLTIGSKFEHNSYTGAEIQPGVRLEWAISPRHTLWTAISRAVRTPSRRDVDLLRFDLGTMTMSGMQIAVSIHGNREFRSEDMLSREAGYRVEIGKRAWLDLAGFYNTYKDLAGFDLGTPALVMRPYPHLAATMGLVNNNAVVTRGGEAAVTFSATEWWKLAGAYSILSEHLERKGVGFVEGSDPRHQMSVRSSLNLPAGLSWDVALYHVAQVTSLNALSHTPLPSYTRLDSHVARRLPRGLELAFSLENIQGGHHIEQDPEAFGWGSQIGRTASLKITWRSEN